MKSNLRVLIAKPGLDGHDQGAKVVVRALMDAGFEVIYSGLRQSPEAVAKIALEEDVDVIGLSSMAGSHMLFCQRLGELLQAHELTDKLWLIGGNIPQRDFADLHAIGLSGIFPTGTDFKEIVSFIKENVA